MGQWIYLLILLALSNHVICGKENEYFDLGNILNNQTLHSQTNLKQLLTPQLKNALNNFDIPTLLQNFQKIHKSGLILSPKCNKSISQMLFVLENIKKLTPFDILKLLQSDLGKGLNNYYGAILLNLAEAYSRF